MANAGLFLLLFLLPIVSCLPVFPKTSYTFSVPENVPAGFQLGHVVASEASGARLEYSFTRLTATGADPVFSINRANGTVSTLRSPDREVRASYQFLVKAKEAGSSTRSATTSMTVTVTDLNDNAPVCEEPVQYLKRPEGKVTNSLLTTVRATDPDAETNAHVLYRLATSHPLFTVDPSSGEVRTLATSFDREATASYILRVLAVDQPATASDQRTATCLVNLTIGDVNDNAPTFQQAVYTATLREDYSSANGPFLTLVAEDPDAGENARVTYRIISGDADKTFVLGGSSGKLSVRTKLDYETKAAYTLTVQATNGGGLPRPGTAEVRIRVLDLNDAAPVFSHAVYTADPVRESVAVGYLVLRVEATDQDSGLNGSVFYRLPTASDLPFNIGERSGEVRTTRKLDRETKAMYTFPVEARDGGRPPLSAQATVSVTLIDENDNRPTFTKSEYRVSVSDDTAAGKTIVEVEAKDPDSGVNGLLSYSITSGNDEGLFSITNNLGKGLIKLTRSVEGRRGSSSLIIKATDAASPPLTSTATVIISLTPANRHSPVFSKPSYSIPVAEDFPVDRTFFRLLATDADGPTNGPIGQIRFSLEATVREQFAVNETSGELSLRRALDRETRGGYSFTATAKDGGDPARSAVASIVVEVTDVNDNAPVFVKSEVTKEVKENAKVGDLVYQMTATDADSGENKRLVYSMSGGDNHFRITPDDGKVRVARVLDRETKDKYRLVVTASDSSASVKKSATALLTVVILDVNDNPPVWPKPRIEMFVPENSPANTRVGVLRASDPDIGVNAVIKYRLLPNVGPDAAPPDYFVVNTFNNSAQVVTTRATKLDYEAGPRVFNLTAQALSGALFSSIQLVIRVTDVNDHPPVLHDFTIQLNNYEGQFPVGSIGRVPAFDPDVTAVLRYRLLESNKLRILSIDRDNGSITLNSSVLNTNVDTDSSLMVEVFDGIHTVQANCTVKTRFITLVAVGDSATVHLAQTPAILSQRVDGFARAVAALFGQPAESFLLLSIETIPGNSTSKAKASFAIRVYDKTQPHVSSFLNASSVRELVYLRTRNISAESQIEVVPHDDSTLCLVEPCINFKVCRERNSFDKAANFVTISPYLLLRSILVRQQASCVCPVGFAGIKETWSCNAEVNMCYSSPCLHGGSCSPREGGFHCRCPPAYVGPRCQYLQTGPGPKYTPPFPTALCRPPSRFESLINGGFRCVGCPEPVAQHTSLCQLRSRYFSGLNGSHAALPPLHQRSHLVIELHFVSVDPHGGLLLYAGRFATDSGDFLWLKVEGGLVRAGMSLGNVSEAVEVSLGPGQGRRFDDGRWHGVRVEVGGRGLTLSRHGCDVGPAVRWNDSCAVKKVVELPGRCDDREELCYRFLDMKTPLYVGGRPGDGWGRSFAGCVGNVSIDGRLVDLRGDLVYQEGTLEGCPAMRERCSGLSCTNGRCLEVWGGTRCICPDAFSGQRCAVSVPQSSIFSLKRQPAGSAVQSEVLLDYSASPSLQVPREIALDFRTLPASSNVTLFKLETHIFENSLYLLSDGRLEFRFTSALLLSCGGKVNLTDGEWHRVAVRLDDRVSVDVDHGLCNASAAAGSTDTALYSLRIRVLFGAGLNGCVRQLSASWWPPETAPPVATPRGIGNVTVGCSPDGGGCSDCPVSQGRAQCVSGWRTSRCQCRPGFVGASCRRVCLSSDPCLGEGARCEMDAAVRLGYRCRCPVGRSGQYCAEVQRVKCPDAWWGAPFCGPCNCRVDLGFAARCNTSTGRCSCRAGHYQQGDLCLRCPCYARGTVSSECSASGQCPCRSGVVGLRCDRCDDPFAEVTTEGCVVQYTACPEALADGIWWSRTALDTTAKQTCPEGLVGHATRECTRRDGWGVPNTALCVSSLLNGLTRDVGLLEDGKLQPTQHQMLHFASVLHDSLSNRTSLLYAGDLTLSARVLRLVLAFETGRDGFELSHTRDSAFLPNLITAVDALFAPATHARWQTVDVSVSGLIDALARFTAKLAAQRDLRTRISYSAGGVALRVRPMPAEALLVAAGGHNVSVAMEAEDSRAGTLFFANLTGLMGGNVTTESQYEPGPLQVASGVLALEVPAMVGRSVDVALRFSVTDRESLLEVQCVFWSNGSWSREGCLTHNLTESPPGHVTCVCSHLSTFAVLGRRPPLLTRRVPVTFPASVYVFGGAGLLLLLPALLALGLVLRTGFNCLTVHFHHDLALFLALGIYLAALRALEHPVLCCLTAVLVQYFSAASLAWLMVDALHLYRRLTEMRNVDVGAMPFYLLLGYALPGIVVSLSVALKADDFGGTGRLCWVRVASSTAVSVLLPMGCCAVAILVLVVMAVVRMARAGFLCAGRTCCGGEEGRPSSLQTLDTPAKKKKKATSVAMTAMPSSLRYNRPDLLTSISRADSRRTSVVSRISDTRSSRCRCRGLVRLTRRTERFGEGPAWALYHLGALLILCPLSLLAWLLLYLGPASEPPNTAMWETGGALVGLLCAASACLHALVHARVLPALHALGRHGGQLPKEMRATALGAAAGRYAPNPALEAEFNKLSVPAGASTSSTTTTSGGNTVIPGVYLAATTDSSTLNPGSSHLDEIDIIKLHQRGAGGLYGGGRL